MLRHRLVELAEGYDSNVFRQTLHAEMGSVPELLAGKGRNQDLAWRTQRRVDHTLQVLRELPVDALTLPMLTKLALSKTPLHREAAFAALDASSPDKVPVKSFIEALTARTKETRIAAAECLLHFNVKDAHQALTDALAEEQIKAVRDAMTHTLTALGGPIGSAVIAKKPPKKAPTALKQETPTALAFLSIETLPEVHKLDGALLDQETLTAWIVRAHKAETPIASADQRSFTATLHAVERESLGRAIFDRWYQEDFALRDLTPEEDARVKAYALAQNQSEDEVRFLPEFRIRTQEAGGGTFIPQGANEHRGVLALAAALAPRFLASACVRYVKRYRQQRVNQSRTMIQMLAGMETGEAMQSLIALANQALPSSLSWEANRRVEELAKARCWTEEELAEHTIPSAGLDEDGMLHLAFGKPTMDEDERETTRSFVAQLTPNLELQLYALDERGSKTPIARLPEPTPDEDDKHARDEQKRLAATLKDLHFLVQTQHSRLYRAMLGELTWTPEAFASIYLAHPVMKHIARRLFLRVTRPSNAPLVCRPSDDGGYVNSVDNSVDIASDAKIQLAHSTHLTPEEEALWAQHCADYKLFPFLPQLGQEPFPLDASHAAEERMKASKRVPAMALRAQLTALGFARKPDNKRIWLLPVPGAELTVRIMHTPSSFGEDDEVLLQSLDFPYGGGRKLHQVPKVLLNASWNLFLSLMA